MRRASSAALPLGMHHDYDVGAHHYAGHNNEPGDYHYGGEHDVKHYHDHEYDGPGDDYNEHVYHDDDHGGWHHHHGDDGSTVYHDATNHFEHAANDHHVHVFIDLHGPTNDGRDLNRATIIHYGPADHDHDKAA